MNYFQALGEAELLRYEGSRLLASALADSVRGLLTRLSHLLGEAPHHSPGRH
jgi:hypothetical protein